MRKVITGVLVAVLFTGLFVGSWFLTGTLSGDQAAPAPVSSLPADGNGDAGEASGEASGDVTGGEDVINFPRPKSITDLWTGAEKVFDTLNANPIVRGRALTYATLALYETSRTKEENLVVLDKLVARPGPEAFFAAGHVLAGVVDNPLLTKAVKAWDVELTAPTLEAAEKIIAIARADGFAEAGLASAPKFEGSTVWQPGGRRDGLPEGFEPGFGKVKPILFDINACPVAPAPVADIERERASMGDVPTDTVGPALPTPEALGGTFRIYLEKSDISEDPLVRDEFGALFFLLAYDSLIATWNAKWENGVAAPVDIASGDVPDTRMSYPSYPSWEAVVIGIMEGFASELSGRQITATNIRELASAVPTAAATNEYPLPIDFDRMLKSLSENVFHWDVDVSAGKDLGACLARQAANFVKK